MKSRFFSGCYLVALPLLCLFTACGDDDVTVGTQERGTLSLEITDAPVDDPAVSAVFVTVAEVRLDGQRIEGFQRTTVELSALQNGRTATLGKLDVAAQSYGSVDLVLDAASDASGSGPGCYVRTNDGTKVALDVASDGLIRLRESDLTVAANATVNAVVDFDLRKALLRTDSASEPYEFGGEQRLRTAVRFVCRDESGTLTGRVSNATSEDGRVVIYAYAAGAYTASEAEGDENNRFLNATSSTTLQSDGKYTLAFLPGGNYELVAVAYEDTDNDDRAELKGRFSLSALAGLNLGSLSVGAASTTEADFTLTALLP